MAINPELPSATRHVKYTMKTWNKKSCTAGSFTFYNLCNTTVMNWTTLKYFRFQFSSVV